MTIAAICVRAPVSRFTAVCDVPPPAGIEPNSAPPTLATPVANNSTLARGSGSSGAWKARPAAIVSVKLISAMPTAPGHNCCAIDQSVGIVSDGNPLGIAPTTLDAVARKREQRGCHDGPGDGNQRRGPARPKVLDDRQHRDGADTDRERRPGQMREAASDFDDVVHERPLREVHAEDLRQLIDDDHDGDARLEADQHRRRDEIRDEAEPERGREDQHAPDHSG